MTEYVQILYRMSVNGKTQYFLMISSMEMWEYPVLLRPQNKKYIYKTFLLV